MFSTYDEYKKNYEIYQNKDNRYMISYYDKIIDIYTDSKQKLCDKCIIMHVSNEKLSNIDYVFENGFISWWELCDTCKENIKKWWAYESNCYIQMSYDALCGGYDSEIESYDIKLDNNIEYTNVMLNDMMKFERWPNLDTIQVEFQIILC